MRKFILLPCLVLCLLGVALAADLESIQTKISEIESYHGSLKEKLRTATENKRKLELENLITKQEARIIALEREIVDDLQKELDLHQGKISRLEAEIRAKTAAGRFNFEAGYKASSLMLNLESAPLSLGRFERIKLSAGLGYGFGNAFNIQALELIVNYDLNPDLLVGLTLGQLNFSERVKNIFGLSYTVEKGAAFGLGGHVVRYWQPFFVKLGYSNLLGLSLSAGRKF